MDETAGRDDESASCLNCGSTLEDRWCAHCGQDGHRRLAPFPVLVRRVVGETLDLDGRLLQTLRTLLLRPGLLTREYALGRFQQQVASTRLYLAASAFYFLLAPWLGGGRVRFEEEGGVSSQFEFGPLGWDSELLLLVLVPLWAFALRAFLWGKRRHLEEAFVFSVHYNVFFLVFMLVLAAGAQISSAIGAPDLAMWLLLVGAFLPLLYLGRALRVAFDLDGARRTVTAFVLFLAHLVSGQLIYNLLESGRLVP